jgi:methylenetetrahydrofolate dehydrogenase (NADP+) / methenyltetrahydrofolate cyclohydrolase
MPQADGSIAGDIHPSAQKIPQHTTPVPGGIGPGEMAVLMDRIVRQEADPGRQPWTFPQMPVPESWGPGRAGQPAARLHP